MAHCPMTVGSLWVLLFLGAHALSTSDFLYYYPAPTDAQANILGYYPPFIAFPVPNQEMSDIRSYYAASCGAGSPVPAPPAPSTMGCVPSSLPDLNSPVQLCSVGNNGSITVTKRVTISNVSGVAKEDIYLVSDITGSMITAIAAVKKGLSNIIASRKVASADVQIGVGKYADESYTGFRGYHNLQPITSNFTKVKSAIETYSAVGGGDPPEADLVALEVIATSNSIGWRNGSRRIVALLGDAPGHEPSCVSINNVTKALNRYNVASSLRQKGIILVAVDLGGLNDPTYSRDCNNLTYTKGGQMTYIANATGGNVVVAPSDDAVTAGVLDAISDLAVTIKVDMSNCTGLAIKYTPSLPLTVMPGSSLSLEQTLTTSPSVCAGAGYRCTIKYTASGSAFATQNISVTC